LIQKVKLLLMFQSVDLYNLAKCRHRKVTNSNIKVWVFKNLDKSKNTAMISAFKVGVRVMLNKDRLGNTQVLDSSLVKRTASK
jgi:hypothetical protein